MKVDLYNLQGKKTGNVEVDVAVFGAVVKEELVNEVYVAQRANKRRGLSHTKTVGERRGSTRKPWRQKGTGRARTGSIRNPIWRKGGVTFGPTKEQNFSKKVNKKVVKKAFVMALSAKVKDGKLVVVEDYNLKESKTKLLAEALGKLKIDKRVMITHLKPEKEIVRIGKNIPLVSNELVANVNVLNVLDNTFILISKEGLKQLQKRMKGEKVIEKKQVSVAEKKEKDAKKDNKRKKVKSK